MSARAPAVEPRGTKPTRAGGAMNGVTPLRTAWTYKSSSSDPLFPLQNAITT